MVAQDDTSGLYGLFKIDHKLKTISSSINHTLWSPPGVSDGDFNEFIDINTSHWTRYQKIPQSQKDRSLGTHELTQHQIKQRIRTMVASSLIKAWGRKPCTDFQRDAKLSNRGLEDTSEILNHLHTFSITSNSWLCQNFSGPFFGFWGLATIDHVSGIPKFSTWHKSGERYILWGYKY